MWSKDERVGATVKIIKFRTRKFAVITLKIEQDGFSLD